MQSKTPIATVALAGKGKQLNVLGHSITTLLTEDTTGGKYYVYQCVTPPGHGLPLHVQEQEDKIMAIVEGEFSVSIDNKRFHAMKGDICFFPKKVYHSFQNIGTKAGITLWTVIPGVNHEKFFDAMAELPAGDPVPSTVAKIFAEHGMKIKH